MSGSLPAMPTRFDTDARALEERLRMAVRWRRPVRRGEPRALLDGRFQLPAGADRRRRCRATSEDAVETLRVCRDARRAGPLARRRHEPRRAVLQRRGRARLLAALQPRAGNRPREANRPRRAGSDPGRPAPGRAGARADLRSGSGDPRVLHARRDDRQRLLRSALGHGGLRGRGRSHGPPDRRDGRRHGRRRADDGREDLAGRACPESSRRAAGVARSTRRWRNFATSTPTGFGRASPTSLGASPATTCPSSCRRTDSTSPGRSPARKGPASRSSRRRSG